MPLFADRSFYPVPGLVLDHDPPHALPSPVTMLNSPDEVSSATTKPSTVIRQVNVVAPSDVHLGVMASENA
jgi:hypothetical protein